MNLRLLNRLGLTCFLFAVTLAVAGCNRDPNYAKHQYLNSGNKYFDRGRYKEALIMYRKALSKDPKFGEAYYRLGLTYQKLGQNATLVGVLRRATELLPKGSPEWNESALTLGEILVQGAIVLDVPGRNKPLMDEVNQLQSVLDAKAPHSFEAYRLRADVLRADAAQAANTQDAPRAKQDIEQSVVELRKSLQVKPNDINTSVALGRSLTFQGDTAGAERLYRGLLDRDKKLSIAYTELYRIYLTQKRPAEAEQILKTAIANNPKDFSFRTLLAGFYFSQGNRSEMTRVLTEMKNNFKDFPQAYITAGDFYARINEFDTAMKQYQEGEQKDSGNRSEYEKRQIELLLREGKKEQAYSKTLDMLKANPKDLDARALQANFMLDRGEVTQAITELQDVVTAKPDNFVAHFNLGRAHASRNEYPQAMQQYREAFRIRPDYIVARLALAETELKAGEFGAGLQAAQDAEKYSPNNPSAQLLEAMALMHLLKNDEARKILEALVAKYPHFSEAQLELGSLDARENKFDAARELFEKAYLGNPADLRPLLGESETYLAQKQPGKAVEIWKREAASHPARGDIARQYATMRARTGDLDGALADYQSLLQRFTLSPRETAQTYAALGELYVQKGDANSAIAWLQKAKALEPGSVNLLNFLGEIETRTGRQKEAQADYHSVLAIDPNNGQALNNLAFSMADSGANLNEALTLANHAKRMLPNSNQVNDTLGWIYIKKHMGDAAADVFSALVAKAPENPTYRFHYCMALSEKGDKAGAQKQCAAALADNPGKNEADQVRQLLTQLH